MQKGKWILAGLLSLVVGFADRPLAEEALRPNTPPEKNAEDTREDFARFEKMMSGVKLVGRFTVLGKKNQPLAEEEYTIHRVTKLPNGDYWLFQTRIKYGKVDVTLPLPLEVKWAGDTPVITLTKLTIPGLGTFGSRVVVDNQKYAGTWSHGEVQGHLFGVIQKLGADPPEG